MVFQLSDHKFRDVIGKSYNGSNGWTELNGMLMSLELPGIYLELALDKNWLKERKRKIVGSALLDKAIIPNLPFENADGSKIYIDTDYFGKKRNRTNPSREPFEILQTGKQKIKVW